MRRTTIGILFMVAMSWSVMAYPATEYIVKKGDSLSRIAKRYKMSTEAVRSENGLRTDRLTPGMTLLIPSGGNADPEMQVKEGTGVQERPLSSPASELADEPYHVVKKGETLSLLAKRHSIGIDELMEINGLSSSKLKAGQKILVRRQGPRIHTVKKGDTLAKIAKKFGMDVDDLAEINEMESLSLKVGRKLYIDENPAALAALEGVDEEDVEKKIQALSESDGPDEKSLPEKLVYFAKKLLNIPYKFGGTSIFGIDCSAYVRKVYGSLGIQLPRTAREQFLTGEAVERDRLSIGDLVFFRTYAGFPSHVGIYLGNNLFIHASAKGRKVAISNLDTPYYLKRFIGAKRLITEEADENKEQG